MGANDEEIKRLNEEIKRKQKELESPFDNVGLAETPRPRGRPPKHITAVDGDAAKAAQETAHEQRMTEIVRPASDLTPEGMRDWGEKELHKLIPEALSRLKWNVKYGDNRDGNEAADKILKATGLSQKEASNFGKGGQIVINLNGAANDIKLPFLDRTTKKESK